jgi:hypothetical protein
VFVLVVVVDADVGTGVDVAKGCSHKCLTLLLLTNFHCSRVDNIVSKN